MIKKTLKSRIFITFLVSYLLLLLVPLLVGVASYREALKAVERDAQQASLASLKQTMIALDSRFAEIESIATQLAINPSLQSFAREDNPYVDRTVPYRIRMLQSELSQLILTNNFVDILAVYFKRSDVTITSSNSHLHMQRYYGDFIQYNDMSSEEWASVILDQMHYLTYLPAAPVELMTMFPNTHETKQMLMLVQSFPMRSLDGGQIMILINQNKLEDLMQDFSFDDGGYAYIIDQDDQLLAHFNTPAELDDSSFMQLIDESGTSSWTLDGRQMIVTHVTSEHRGWKYVAVIPYAIVMAKVQAIRQLILVFLLIALIAGLLGAFIFAYLNSRPIRQLVDDAHRLIGNSSSNEVANNEYAFLRSSIMDLVSSNQQFEENYMKQLPLLKATFVSRLLSGEFKNDGETRLFAEQLGFPQISGLVAVVIARTDKLGKHSDNYLIKEINAIKVILNDTLNMLLERPFYYHDIDFEKRVLIFDLPHYRNLSEHKSAASSEIEKLFNKLSQTCERYGISFRFFAGSLTDHVSGISKSFDEAIETMNTLSSNDNRFTWHEMLSSNQVTYYYPVQIEAKLINMLLLGHCHEVEQIMSRIATENFEKRQLSYGMKNRLIEELCGTLYKIADNMESESAGLLIKQVDLIYSHDDQSSVENQFNSLSHTIHTLCQKISDQKKSSHSMIDEIDHYLAQHYMDSQLSLTVLADHFGYAPAYLSQLFKEKHFGKNFSTHLEELRISHACTLLAEGIAIKKISEKVGYNSVHVFRKAFQRVIGTAPSGYTPNSDDLTKDI